MLKKPWFWILVAGVVVINAIPLYLIGSVMHATFYAATVPTEGEDATCVSRVMDAKCTDIKPHAIERMTGMVLPEGTVVQESNYRQFQDWHLDATLIIPADGIAEWEQSLGTYEPATVEACLGTPPAGMTCADRSRELADERGSYQRLPLADGSLQVEVIAFNGA